MGGFGSGGVRVGAGGKAKREAERKLTGARARTKALDAGVPAAIDPVPMPAGMSAGQMAAWAELAPHATAAGTLVPASASAFRDLCEIVALRREMFARIVQDGHMVGDEPHPLLTHERQYRLREEAGKARFMVLPAGKPMAAKQEAVDPWAEFDQPVDAPKGANH